jgi:hypothetical protein
VATLAARNENEAVMVPIVWSGRVFVWGFWSHAVGFVLDAFGRNGTSVGMMMCSHLIYFIKKFYK